MRLIAMILLCMSFSACAWNYVTPVPAEVPPGGVPNDPNTPAKPADWTDGAYTVTLNGANYDIFIAGNTMTWNSVAVNNIEYREIAGIMYWAGNQTVPSDFYGIRRGLLVAIHINGRDHTGTARRVTSNG